jgi:hypothetical protein
MIETWDIIGYLSSNVAYLIIWIFVGLFIGYYWKYKKDPVFRDRVQRDFKIMWQMSLPKQMLDDAKDEGGWDDEEEKEK